MSSCDICGAQGDLRAIVEGAEMTVCLRCARYGKLLNRPATVYANSAPAAVKEVELVSSYGKLITSSRNALGLTLVQLANKLNLREKDLLHFEEGKAKPSEREASKLENLLKIKLVKQIDRVEAATGNHSKKELTLADVVVIKDKRKQ